jgi:hypothetical protein
MNLESGGSASWPAGDKLEKSKEMFSQMMGQNSLDQMKDLDRNVGYEQKSIWHRLLCCCPCFERICNTQTYIHYY